MLTKRSQQVFVAGHAAVPYRPYSKTCPPVPPVTPPKRWVTKTLCGTYTVYRYTVYLSLGGTATVQETQYVIPGLPATSVFNSGPPPQDWSGVATPYPLPVVSTGPYCKTVTVYE